MTNKKAKEDMLNNTLEKLNGIMSELGISHDIHQNDEELETLLKKTYLHTYTFSIESSYYYILPRWKRILKTVTEPPEVKVKTAADDLEKAMGNVRARCLILTQKRIEQMDLRLQEVEKYTKETHHFEKGMNYELESSSSPSFVLLSVLTYLATQIPLSAPTRDTLACYNEGFDMRNRVKSLWSSIETN